MTLSRVQATMSLEAAIEEIKLRTPHSFGITHEGNYPHAAVAALVAAAIYDPHSATNGVEVSGPAGAPAPHPDLTTADHLEINAMATSQLTSHAGDRQASSTPPRADQAARVNGTINALEWAQSFGTIQHAVAMGWRYMIGMDSDGQWFWWRESVPHRRGRAPSENAAKAAAQADYSARILAAIQPDPESQLVAWQRNHPGQVWIDVNPEDIKHYRSVGQAIRPLFATASSAGMVSGEAAVACLDDFLRREDIAQGSPLFDRFRAALRALAGERG